MIDTKSLTDEQRKRMNDTFNQRLPQILKCDPIVLMELNGVECKLYMDNKAVRDFYSDTGVNLIGRFNTADIYKPDVFPHLLHRSLQRYQPKTTMAEIDALDFRKIMYYRDRVMACIDLFIPDISDVEAAIIAEQTTDPHSRPIPIG